MLVFEKLQAFGFFLTCLFSFNELKLIKYYKNFCGFDLFIEAILIDTYFKLTPLNKHKL